MNNKNSLDQAIEIAERNRRAWAYIRRSKKQREVADGMFPGWFNFVFAVCGISCGYIWANIMSFL